MHRIVLDAEAGQISAELSRCGVAAHARVHVLVDVIDTDELPMAAIARPAKPSIGWRPSLTFTRTLIS
jgi:hypothetical protein